MQTNAPLRIGLVGAGGISHAHLPNLLRLGAEVLVHSEDGAPGLVRQYGGTQVDTLEELLESVDYVDVVTPTYTHYTIVKRALEAGKHVISEKPLARTDEQAAELRDVARALGLRLYPAHVVRYFPEYVKLRDAVRQGRLGDLAVLRFYRSGSFPQRPWFADRALSGGIIMDQMIHDLDIARWIAGEVRTVSAFSTRRDIATDKIDAAHVMLTHASGAVTQLSGVWGPSHLRFTTGYSVTGTAGFLSHDSAAAQGYVSDLPTSHTGGEAVPDSDPAADPYFLELQEYLAGAQGTGDPRVSADDGVEAVRIANAALRSLDCGEPIALR